MPATDPEPAQVALDGPAPAEPLGGPVIATVDEAREANEDAGPWAVGDDDDDGYYQIGDDH
jgi:hypothetical protein